MSLKNVLIIVDNIDESIDFYEELFTQMSEASLISTEKQAELLQSSDISKLFLQKG